ncbi:hypothetical protein EDB19DRAFT_1834792 [Suillus lakei]|nr:hypothetical protein EDB19DRAFT_1834792 [Suillus lakei]
MPGPSSVLISRIEHLGRLLKNLPQSLPLDPPNSSYDFGLDTEMVEEEGVWFAFNRNMEVCFETHKLGRSGTITFRERGRHCEALVGMFKETVKKLAKDSERDFLHEVWLEWLINAAQQQGAKDLQQTGGGSTKRPAPEIHISAVDEHPEKCLKASHSPHTDARLSTVNVDSNSEGHKSDIELNVQCKHVTICMVENPQPSTLPVVINSQKTKQMSFSDFAWKPLHTKEEKAKQWERLAKITADDDELMKQEEETLKAAQEQRKKILATEPTQPKGKKTQKNVNEAESQTSSLSTMDLTELSRPDSNWKDQRTGKNGGTKQEQHHQTNWYHPFLWTHIEQIAPKVGWSAQTIASRLARDQPSLFSHLNKGTVQKWLDKETKHGSGQTGVLANMNQAYYSLNSNVQRNLFGRSSRLALQTVISCCFNKFGQWIENILEPWRKVVIETDPNLDDDQHAIVYLDCYPVHTSQDFHTYVWEKYPCTGKFQPADVGLNQVIKHRLKQNQVNFLVEAHSSQISCGLVPEQVKFTTSLPVLRDASVAALVDVYDFMMSAAGCELVKKGWERCIAKEWNLSGDYLTSKQSRTALNTYLHTHNPLCNEIKNRMGTVHNDSEESLECVEEIAVINDALGILIDKAYNLNLGYVVSEVKQAADQTLMAAGDAEDVWAWNNREQWGEKLPTVSTDEP